MRLQFACEATLTDIEGTLGSVSFVKDVLFPYSRDHLGAFVRRHRHEPLVEAALADASQTSGLDVRDEEGLIRTLKQWIAQDRKATSLKALQGAIWARGYEDGTLHAHIYDDALEALRAWHRAGIGLYVYSSGSVEAQRLFFSHSVAGDVAALFDDYFDTTIGPKDEASSYHSIAERIGVRPQYVLFLSDTAAELRAARDAGLRTCQVVRAQDGVQPAPGHAFILSFDQLELRSLSALLDR